MFWWWCFDCERAFKSEIPAEIVAGENGKSYDDWADVFCPFEGCGATPMEVYPYEYFRLGHGLPWPEVPKEGERYSLYGPVRGNGRRRGLRAV